MSYAFTGVFPPTDVGFFEGQDARFYGVELEDSTIRSDMEGGYEFARPRFTRKPRKTFKTGFTAASENDCDIVVAFWEEYQGFRQFTWTNPASLTVHTVRMVEPPIITYAGSGALRRYDIEVILKEV